MVVVVDGVGMQTNPPLPPTFVEPVCFESRNRVDKWLNDPDCPPNVPETLTMGGLIFL